MITDYMNNCIFCGKPTENVHHTVYGFSKRKLSDEDELLLPLCFKHHEEIHLNGIAGTMSKMIGQLAYERDRCAEGKTQEDARDMFRKRYGNSYL